MKKAVNSVRKLRFLKGIIPTALSTVFSNGAKMASWVIISIFSFNQFCFAGGVNSLLNNKDYYIFPRTSSVSNSSVPMQDVKKMLSSETKNIIKNRYGTRLKKQGNSSRMIYNPKNIGKVIYPRQTNPKNIGKVIYPRQTNPKSFPKRSYVPGEVIIGIKPGISDEAIREMVEEIGGKINGNIERHGQYVHVVITVPEGKEKEIIALLEEKSEVKYAELNGIISIDPPNGRLEPNPLPIEPIEFEITPVEPITPSPTLPGWSENPSLIAVFDFDGDGKFDFSDLLSMYKAILSGDADPEQMDLNGDGEVNVGDLLLGYQILTFSKLSDEGKISLLNTLSPKFGAVVVSALVEEGKIEETAELIAKLSPDKAAEIMGEMGSTAAAQIVYVLDVKTAGIILEKVGAEKAAEILTVIIGNYQPGEEIDLSSTHKCVAILKAMDNPEQIGAILNALFELSPEKILQINFLAASILVNMAPQKAAEIISEMSPDNAAYIVNALDVETAAKILENVDSDKVAEILAASREYSYSGGKGLIVTGTEYFAKMPIISAQKAADILSAMSPDKAAEILSCIAEDITTRTGTGIYADNGDEAIKISRINGDPERAASILENMSPQKAAEIVNRLKIETAVKIFENMDSGKVADILSVYLDIIDNVKIGSDDMRYIAMHQIIPVQEAADILSAMNPDKAAEILSCMVEGTSLYTNWNSLEKAASIIKTMMNDVNVGVQKTAEIITAMKPANVAAIMAIGLTKDYLLECLTVSECVDILETMDNPEQVGAILEELYPLNSEKTIEIIIGLLTETETFKEILEGTGFKVHNSLNVTPEGMTGCEHKIFIIENPEGELHFIKATRVVYPDAKWEVQEELEIVSKEGIDLGNLTGTSSTAFTIKSSKGEEYVITGSQTIVPEMPWGNFHLGAGHAPGKQEIAVTASKKHLADTLKVEIGAIRILRVEEVEWPDTGLGCPEPGMLRAQVITPGYKIFLEINGKDYEYHTDLLGNVKLAGEIDVGLFKSIIKTAAGI